MDTQEEKKSALSPRTFCRWKMHRQTPRPESWRQTPAAHWLEKWTHMVWSGGSRADTKAGRRGEAAPFLETLSLAHSAPTPVIGVPSRMNGYRWFLKGFHLPSLLCGGKH